MKEVVVSFNAGELTPLIDARTDLAKYSSGCRTLENMIPRIYGSATRRPGSKFIYEEKDSDKKSILVGFEYSNNIAYITEFSDQCNRFFFDGAILLDPINPTEVVTPYLEADLFQLQFKQSNDVMWITHESYAPRKLTRTTATSFSLDTITFNLGPFLERNDIIYDDSVTMTPSVTTGTGTLTLSATTNFEFKSGHIGALFKLIHPRVNTETSLKYTSPTTGTSTALDVKGTWTFNTHGTWTGTVKIERKADGTNWETFRTYKSVNDRNIQKTDKETDSNVQYRINVTSLTSGTISADLTENSSTQEGIARVTAFNSATNVDITVLQDFASTDAATRWAEGAWSDVQGYPRTFTFFEDRAVYASTTNSPQTIWLSKTGKYEEFEEGSDDNDSFSITISSEKRNAIQWISALEAIVVGTIGGEWRVRATAIEEPITPTNYSIVQQSSYGSKDIQAVGINDVVLYVDRPGRKVRELVYDDNVQKYRSPNLFALAEHITKGGITDISIQKNPESIIWCVLDESPYLISLTYNREQDVIAASKHPFEDGIVESVAVIPGSTEDEIWVSVQRTIDGSTKRYIEQLQPLDFGDQEDAWFVDSGLLYDGVATTTLSGLDHLEGETVAILGDGVAREEKVVTSGQVTVLDEVEKAIVGKKNRYKLTPMKFNQTMRSHGSTKRISEVYINLLETLNLKYGKDIDSLYDMPWPRPTIFDPIELYSGELKLHFDGGFNIEDDILFTGDDPYPCTIRSISVLLDQAGR